MEVRHLHSQREEEVILFSLNLYIIIIRVYLWGKIYDTEYLKPWEDKFVMSASLQT